MKKLVLGICLFSGVVLFAQEPLLTGPPSVVEESIAEEKVFKVELSKEMEGVIIELVTNMGKYSVVRAGLNYNYFANLGRKTRDISSTQFLGYIFTNPKLVKYTRFIRDSSRKWKGFSKGIKRGLAKEAESTLFDDLPAFAKHTGADEATLRHLALEGKWEDFILHLLEDR